MSHLWTSHLAARVGQLTVAVALGFAATCVAAAAQDAPAKTVPSLGNLAILGAFQLDDPATTHLLQLQRARVTPNLDLVVAFGGKTWPPGQQPYPEPRRLGLFLQERARPSRVYRLMTEEKKTDALVRIERVTASDLVLSYVDESSGDQYEKFLFDVRAKSLVNHFTYERWLMGPAFGVGTHAVVSAKANGRAVAVDCHPAQDAMFKVLTGVDADPWLDRAKREEVDHCHGDTNCKDALRWTTFGRRGSLRIVERFRHPGMSGDRIHEVEEIRGGETKRYPVPQSTADELRAARPGEGAGGIDEDIGAWDIEAGQLWIGKSFYNGEGDTGVGGFGWFDEATRSYRILSPPEVRDWSITALHAEKDAVWMALAHFGEYYGSSGGVARYDRVTKAVRVLPVNDIGRQFVRVGDGLLLVGTTSIALVSADGVRSFFVDRMSDGRLRVAEAIAAVSFGRE